MFYNLDCKINVEPDLELLYHEGNTKSTSDIVIVSSKFAEYWSKV